MAIMDAILTSAYEAFVNSGYESATMEGIAVGAGISKGTLYSRFPDKQTLFRAVLQNRIERWDNLTSAVNPYLPSDLAGRLRAHAATLRAVFEWPEYQQMRQLVRTAGTAGYPEAPAHLSDVGTQPFLAYLVADMASAYVPHGASAGSGQPDWAFLARVFLFAFAGWYESEAARGEVDERVLAEFTEKLVASILALVGSPSG